MSKQQFFIYILIVVIITAGILGFLQKRPKYGKVIIGENELKVELSDTISKRKKGLSNYDGLKKNNGMLFVFDLKGKHGIWMKDMKFPIDIIWIRENKIMDIATNISNNDQKNIYYPREDVNFVLEVSAGFSDENNIKIGDNIDIFF